MKKILLFLVTVAIVGGVGYKMLLQQVPEETQVILETKKDETQDKLLQDAGSLFADQFKDFLESKDLVNSIGIEPEKQDELSQKVSEYLSQYDNNSPEFEEAYNKLKNFLSNSMSQIESLNAEELDNRLQEVLAK